MSGVDFQHMNNNPAGFVAKFLEERNVKPLDTWGWQRLRTSEGGKDFNINGLVRIKRTELGKVLAVSGDKGLFTDTVPWPETVGRYVEWVETEEKKSAAESLRKALSVRGPLGLCCGKKQIGRRRIITTDTKLRRTWTRGRLQDVGRGYGREGAHRALPRLHRHLHKGPQVRDDMVLQSDHRAGGGCEAYPH